MVARPWETRLMDATDSDTPPPHTLSSSPGSSSICTSNTAASGTTGLVSDNSSSQANKYKPSHISMTESTKAKRRTNRALRQSMDEFQFRKSSPVLDPSYISSYEAERMK